MAGFIYHKMSSIWSMWLGEPQTTIAVIFSINFKGDLLSAHFLLVGRSPIQAQESSHPAILAGLGETCLWPGGGSGGPSVLHGIQLPVSGTQVVDMHPSRLLQGSRWDGCWVPQGAFLPLLLSTVCSGLVEGKSGSPTGWVGEPE